MEISWDIEAFQKLFSPYTDYVKENKLPLKEESQMVFEIMKSRTKPLLKKDENGVPYMDFKVKEELCVNQ